MCADLTMCSDQECKNFSKCYRAQAKANEYRQSYFYGSPRDLSTGECDQFWPLKDKSKEQLDNVWKDWP